MKIWVFSIALLLAPSELLAHGGGTDAHGCHNENATGLYHCHSGTFAGQSFSSKDAMLAQLNTSDPAPSTPTNPDPTDPTTPTNPSTEANPAEYAGTVYNRSDYLPSWADADGDCQNTRHEVLIAESQIPVTLNAAGCSVIAGLWRDPYTDQIFTNPSDLDIDHMVALKEAHDSGAWAWSIAAKRAFANDLTNPHVLIAVDDGANQSKSDRDPAEWMPPNIAYHCQYIKSWVIVKQAYNLSIDPAEQAAINKVMPPGNLPEPTHSHGYRLGETGDIPTAAEFSVGLTKPGICGYGVGAAANDSLAFRATVIPDSAHAGSIADLIIAAQHGPLIVTMNQNGEFIEWDGTIEGLQAARDDVVLSSSMTVDIYSGVLGLIGELNFFVGYKMQDGSLIYTPAPISFTFTN